MKQSTVEKKLQDFTGDEEGKRYAQPDQAHPAKAGEQHDTYFCSGLSLARTRPRSGVLPKNVTANSFTRRRFADKHELKMIDGAPLGQRYT